MTNYDILKEYEAHKTPVPSYDEWQAAYECQLMESELVLTLKELLKECGKQLYEYSDVCLQEGYELEREEVLKLKTKIDNAIGEKK